MPPLAPPPGARRAAVVVVAPVAVALAALLGGCSHPPKPDPAAFCRHYRTASQAAASLRQMDTLPVSEIRRQVDGADDESARAAAVAPTIIRPSVQRLAKALHGFRTQVDDARTHADVNRAADTYRGTAAAVAIDQVQVDSWTRTQCGFTSQGTVAPTTTTTAATAPPTTVGTN